MYRIDSVLLILALLPLIMAILVRGFVIGRRQEKMQRSLNRAMEAKSRGPVADEKESQADESIRQGNTSVQSDLGSLYGVRFFFPASVLSFLYLVAFSIGLSCLSSKGPCAGFLCWPFNCFETKYLYNPVFAAIGAYTFHTGMIVRRSFMSDITKNVYWSSINRLLFSVASSIALYTALGDAHAIMVASFAVAFFPSFIITWLRKFLRQNLGLDQPQIPELEIQLIQGVDIWKEDRLIEEGIESVQNLATANVFTLAAKMHYPMRTIVDWMDQAILIQRFPNQLAAILQAGLPVSAIEFAWMGLNDADGAKATLIGGKLGIDPIIVKEAMDSFGQDVVVRVLWRLWQAADTE